MTDTELLNLIEHYEWIVYRHSTGVWIVDRDGGKSDDGNIELARTDGTLREALRLALKRQAELAPVRDSGT